MSIKKYLSRHLLNIPGWRTNRKIVVIESDDWGSIRMPSKEVYNLFINSGIPLHKCPYNRFDSLASEKDLSDLFNLLVSFKDYSGNHPVITANTVVANPDFERIKSSDYKEYKYEPFTKTLERYPQHGKSFYIWQEGIASGVFHPQFHGREHININLWFRLLQDRHPVFLKAFEYGFWGIGPSIINQKSRINIQAAFDAEDYKELEEHKTKILEGLALFEKIFGYRSKSFIANNYIWDGSLNPVLAENEISVFQGMKYQLLPILKHSKRKMIRHFTGERNEWRQVFLIRNCEFEPSLYPNVDSVSSCLKDIANAFMWKKPAIISSHRLNFVGFINKENRKKNLTSLKNLIVKIQKKWPDVEFMTSDKLGELILNDSIKN